MIYYGMDIRYIAGLFDGEGSVGVYDRAGQTGQFLSVSIANTVAEPLERLLPLYKSSLKQKPIPKRGLRHPYTWFVQGAEALRFLRDIHPHTIVRREQIAVALRFPLGPGGNARTPPEVFALRIELRDTLMAMKRAGGLPGKRPNPPSSPEVVRAVKLYTDGMACREVAEELDLDEAVVTEWVRECGATRDRGEAIKLGHAKRAKTFYATGQRQKAAELYRSGLSSLEISARLGVGVGTITYWLRRMGIARSMSEAQKIRWKKEP